MTASEIKTWVYNHINMKSNIVFNSESQYKLKFENGDTYEWKSERKEYSKKIITVWINGKMAQKSLYVEKWLDNGNYGSELIEELPIDNSAA